MRHGPEQDVPHARPLPGPEQGQGESISRQSPILSIVIPTIGRPTLTRTLRSIPARPSVQVIVVADGTEAHRKAEPQVKALRRKVTYDFNDGWQDKLGHPQRRHGMTLALGRWLAFIDDDDAYTPDGVEALLDACREGDLRPRMFQMRYPDAMILWGSRSLHRCNVGTPMFLTPNLPEELGTWKEERTGDFDFIEQTCLKLGEPVWVERVICDVRPADPT